MALLLAGLSAAVGVGVARHTLDTSKLVSAGVPEQSTHNERSQAALAAVVERLGPTSVLVLKPVDPTPVPEPSGALVLLPILGILMLVRARRRRRGAAPSFVLGSSVLDGADTL
jgi:hypothetical protein